MRPPRRLPRLVRSQELVLGPGCRFGRCGPESPPENADEQVAVLDPEDRVDETLRAGWVEAGKRILFPLHELEPQVAVTGDAVVHLGDDLVEARPFRPDVARRRDHDAKNLRCWHARQLLTRPVREANAAQRAAAGLAAANKLHYGRGPGRK